MSDHSRSFHTSRHLAATPERVYAAFADAAQLTTWWGPDGFRNEFQQFEFREGGTWTLVMVGPDGQRYANQNRFIELRPAARIVIRHDGAPYFSLSVDLSPADDGTRLEWTQVFDDAAVAAAVRPIVEPANEQNLDRLAAVLANT